MKDRKIEIMTTCICRRMLVSRKNIKAPQKHDKRSVIARQILCYLVWEYNPHLVKNLSEILDCPTNDIYRDSDIIKIKTAKSKSCLESYYLSEVEDEISKNKSYEAIAEKQDYSLTKRLFGFTYTRKDIMRRHNAIAAAIEYMIGL